MMKFSNNIRTSLPNDFSNTYLLQNNKMDQENVLIENDANIKNKTMTNFYPQNQSKYETNKSNVKNKIYNLSSQDLRNSMDSSINFNENNKFIFDDKLNFNENNNFYRTHYINMKPRSVKDTFFVHNFNNKPQTKSINGSYYRRKNNSVIIVKQNKEVNSLFDNHFPNLNHIESITKNQKARKLKNSSLEHLKDLLAIQDNKEEKAENVAPNSEIFSSSLNPFESYLERTRADNQKNLLRAEELSKLNEKRSRGTKKTSIYEDYLVNEEVVLSNSDRKNNYEESNIIKDKEEKKSNLLFNDHMSNGFQCGLEYEILESPNRINQNLRYNENEDQELVQKNIITNAKLRDNIKWDKLQPKNEEEDLINYIDMFSSQFVEGKNETFKLYFQNRISYLDTRFKLKTPNDLRSKIGERNKVNDIKKVSSAKPTKIINNIYSYSYAKENENIQDKYNKLMNFSSSNKTHKNSLYFGGINNASNKNSLIKNKGNISIKDNIIPSGNIEDNMKILKKRVYSPFNNNFIVYKNVAYNLKSVDKDSNNNNQINQSSLKLNNKVNDGLKVRFDINCKQYEGNKIIPFKDNCNTSNGFNNLAEDNLLDKNTNKYSNKFNKHNNLQAEKKRLIVKKEFLDKVNWRENKSVKIIKGGKSSTNYILNAENKNEFLQEDFKLKKPLNKYFPNITNSQYYIEDTSKHKFKVLKKQLVKESERVFNILDHLKKAQGNLIDTKRKFLIESTENKLKKYTRSSMRVPV